VIGFFSMHPAGSLVTVGFCMFVTPLLATEWVLWSKGREGPWIVFLDPLFTDPLTGTTISMSHALSACSIMGMLLMFAAVVWNRLSHQ
jgi:hypothetical protein